MRRLGSVAKPLQPAHCVGVWVFEVQIVGWGKGGALVDDVMGDMRFYHKPTISVVRRPVKLGTVTVKETKE